MSENSGFAYFDTIYFDITEFLSEYETHPCLWDKNHEHFKDRKKRMKSEETLGEKLGIMDLKTLRKKIRSVRGTYNTEIRKFKASLDSDGEIYVTKLYWFPLADKFLRVTTDVDADIVIPVYQAESPKRKVLLQKLPKQTGVTVLMARTPLHKHENLEKSDYNSFEDDEQNIEALEDDVFENEEELELHDQETMESTIKNMKHDVTTTDDEPLETFDTDSDPNEYIIVESNHRNSTSTPEFKSKPRKRSKISKRFTGRNRDHSLADVVKSLKEISRSDENEFAAFGRSVAVQLQNMPIEVAVQLQTDIQAHITRARLDVLKKES